MWKDLFDNEYERSLDRIAEAAKADTQLKTEMNIHHMIVSVVEYKDTGRSADHTYENVLANKQGVCDGISKFANELFARTGIRSELVIGDFYENGAFKDHHAWNRVNIDGRWYHVDITLDLNMISLAGHARYDYFNLSDTEISRDHKAFSKRHPCTDDSMEYYRSNGLYVADVVSFDRLVSDAMDRGADHVCFKLPYAYDVDDMVEGLLDRTG